MVTLICCTRPVDDRAHWWILPFASSRCIDHLNESSMDNLNHPWIFAKLRVILRDEIVKGGDEIIERGDFFNLGEYLLNVNAEELLEILDKKE